MNAAKANAKFSKTSIDRFPCSRCGAMLSFVPGTKHLVCDYCGQDNPIEDRSVSIEEYDLHEALRQLAQAPAAAESPQIQCDACGAHFSFETSVHAGQCPFCGTNIVTGTAESKPITPKSLLPFGIDEDQAMQQFRGWVKGLWFAPNKVKAYARESTRLTGVYLPYWTYDSFTESTYTGERGDVYYVNQRVQYVRDGRLVSTVKRVPKIHWSPVRGRVSRFFDDVLVGASGSLPRQILDALEPWDLDNLVPYNESYLSGFRSEFYQVDLDEGFDRAKQVMDSVIYRDICFDIGGDHQRIHHVRTIHRDTTYKHCLLPIWSAGFRYRDKTYRFVVNGRTGKVHGERPYSVWKIALTVIVALSLIGAVLFYLDRAGVFEEIRHQQEIYFQTDRPQYDLGY